MAVQKICLERTGSLANKNSYKIIPDIILGDFDSASIDIINYYKKENIECIKFNPEKDYTDTDLGCRKAKDIGVDKILLFGATGTRMDHMLGNVGLMIKGLEYNIKIEIIDMNNRIFLVDKNSTFSGNNGDLVSFHAMSDNVKNFNITGGRYELHNYDMKLLEPRAICNEFMDNAIKITFASGIIMFIFPND